MGKFNNGRPKDDLPENRPTMMLVNEVSKLFHDRLRNFSDQIGIPDGYRHILLSLKFGDSKTQCEISQVTHLKAPTVSVALQKMEADGLVRRISDEEDLRQSRIFITDKGREVTEKFGNNLKKTEEIALCGLTEEEEETLRKIMLKMRKNMIESEQ